MQQLPEPPFAPVRPRAVIGVDVLADQRDLAHLPASASARGLVEHLRHGPRDLRAARIRLRRRRRRNLFRSLPGLVEWKAERPRRGLRTRLRSSFGRCANLFVFREIRIDDAPLLRPRAPWRAGGDRPAGRPRHRRPGPGAGSPRPRPGRRSRRRRPWVSCPSSAGGAVFSVRRRPSFGIDLLCRLLADMAGIEPRPRSAFSTESVCS